MKASKECRRCRVRLPLGSFYKNAASPSGIAAVCKVCEVGAKRSPRYPIDGLAAIIEERHALGASVESLAAKFGISIIAVRRMLRGERWTVKEWWLDKAAVTAGLHLDFVLPKEGADA